MVMCEMAAKKKKKAAGSAGQSMKKVGKEIKKRVTGKKESKKSRKKGALWYAKEIQRLKLKKRYERIKYRV